MRKIVIFAMILTFIFTLVGCTAHNEPDKKAVESSSTNAVIDTTQVEKLSEKAEGRTVEKSTFLEETTHSPAAETSTEKVSKEPIFSQTTTANTEPKQDIHTQKEMPKSEASEPEITTNTVSEKYAYQIYKPFSHFGNQCIVVFITAKKCSQGLETYIQRMSLQNKQWKVYIIQEIQLCKLLKANNLLN